MTLTEDDRMGVMLSDEAYDTWKGIRFPGERMIALYRFFDENDVLLYVGITKSPPIRLRQHSYKPWCWKAVRMTLEWFPDVETATVAELQAIRAENPKHNVRGKLK